MSSSSDIRDAWKTAIFDHDTIQSYTHSIYNYDVTETSRKERAKFQHDSEINFITYLVRRERDTEQVANATKSLLNHIVEVAYYMRADTDGDNYNTLVDRMQTLDGLVVTELGTSWSSNIDFYRVETERPELLQLDGRDVWRQRHIYTGFEYSSL